MSQTTSLFGGSVLLEEVRALGSVRGTHTEHQMAGKRGNGENSIYQYQGRWYVQGYIHGVRVKVSRPKRAEALAAWDAKVKAAAPGRNGEARRTFM